MNKQSLVSVIEKYYLNGVIEKVKWIVKDKKIKVEFISPNKDMIGLIESDFDMDDCTIAIFDTSQLLKLVGITDQFLTLDINKENKIVTKLLIADKEYNLEYALADLMLIPKLPKFDEPTYEFTFNVDLELINKFNKAKKALGASMFIMQSSFTDNQEKVVNFYVGENNTHSNKVIFSVPTIDLNVPSPKLSFNADYVKEIFDSNKDVVTGLCKVSEQGLIKLEFTGKDSEVSSYIVIAKD